LPGLKRSPEDRPPLSLGDLALLVVVFLLACATFAVEEGLAQDMRIGSRWFGSGGGQDAVRVVSSRRGGVEVNGKPADLAAVGSAVRSALAAREEPLVVVVAEPGSDVDLVLAVLDQIRSIGAPRIKLVNRLP
jgi:biopolymer transport protein ExbD